MSKYKATIYNSRDGYGLGVQLVDEDDEESSLCFLSCSFREEAQRICDFVNEVIENIEK